MWKEAQLAQWRKDNPESNPEDHTKDNWSPTSSSIVSQSKAKITTSDPAASSKLSFEAFWDVSNSGTALSKYAPKQRNRPTRPPYSSTLPTQWGQQQAPQKPPIQWKQQSSAVYEEPNQSSVPGQTETQSPSHTTTIVNDSNSSHSDLARAQSPIRTSAPEPAVQQLDDRPQMLQESPTPTPTSAPSQSSTPAGTIVSDSYIEIAPGFSAYLPIYESSLPISVVEEFEERCEITLDAPIKLSLAKKIEKALFDYRRKQHQ